MHDLFQDYYYFNVDEINASDSKEFIITYKQKWYEIAEHEYQKQNSGTPNLNYIMKSVFRNFPRIRTFSQIAFRALIIKDADSLNMDLQQALRRSLEMSHRTCRFCLICQNLSKIIDPIRSRFVVLHFTPLQPSYILAILRYIVEKENLSITDEALAAIIHLGRQNMIRTINLLQTTAAFFPGKSINEDAIHKISDQIIDFKVKEMISLGISKEFRSARTILRELFLQYGLIGSQITDYIRLVVQKLPIPEKWKIIIFDCLGEYEGRIHKSATEEIQLSAFIAQLGILPLN